VNDRGSIRAKKMTDKGASEAKFFSYLCANEPGISQDEMQNPILPSTIQGAGYTRRNGFFKPKQLRDGSSS
jgi:hypothetical protein